jgi:hypothetical protein
MLRGSLATVCVQQLRGENVASQHTAHWSMRQPRDLERGAMHRKAMNATLTSDATLAMKTRFSPFASSEMP